MCMSVHLICCLSSQSTFFQFSPVLLSLQLTTLELQYVSPKLLECQDLELAIPGTYEPHQDVIHIKKVSPSLNVITSKQRPRKLIMEGINNLFLVCQHKAITSLTFLSFSFFLHCVFHYSKSLSSSSSGSNGHSYMFLLKGHEDLRQDERVMQLFGLVNTLLANDPETFRRHLRIQRYSVIPLSPNSGLIGWVPHCDTIHALIRDYRDKKKIMLNIEHRLMLQVPLNSVPVCLSVCLSICHSVCLCLHVHALLLLLLLLLLFQSYQQTSSDYDHLMLMQKVEVFEQAINSTTGDDLAKVLWLKSPNSEVHLSPLSSSSSWLVPLCSQFSSFWFGFIIFLIFMLIYYCTCRCGLIVVLTTPVLWQSCPWLDMSWDLVTGMCVCVYYQWYVTCIFVCFITLLLNSLLLSSCFVSFSSFSSLYRHPSNLMLDRLTGRILHIDFGDCFEVAMTREKFPEKIPFRLTRMLTNAMEVSNNTYMW